MLDLVACPRCGSSPRLWKLEGDFTEERMANGIISCPEDHKWNVTEEVLRFDKEKNEEPMQFPDRPKTGFPETKYVSEEERGGFLSDFGVFVASFMKESDNPLVLYGNSILFFKFIPPTERLILVVNPEEETLREIQELSAKKLIYKNVSSIKATMINILGKDIEILHLLIDEKQVDSLNDGDIVLYFSKEGEENAIWKGGTTSLIRERL